MIFGPRNWAYHCEGGPANSADNANEKEIELVGTRPSDAQNEDWGNQARKQEDQNFEQDMNGEEDKKDKEVADPDEEEDRMRELMSWKRKMMAIIVMPTLDMMTCS